MNRFIKFIKKLFTKNKSIDEIKINNKETDGTIEVLDKLNDLDVFSDKEKTKLKRSIITKKKRNYAKYIPNINLAIKANAYGYSIDKPSFFFTIYRQDSHIRATINQLIDKVISLEFDIEPYIRSTFKCGLPRGQDKTIYKYVKEQFTKNIDIVHHVKQMLLSLITGMSIFQIEYKEGNQHYDVNSIEYRNPDCFQFKPNLKGKPILVYTGEGLFGKDTVLDMDYFFVYANRETDINPYGESEIGISGFWLYHFKKIILECFFTAAETHSDPALIIEYENRIAGAKDKAFEIAQNYSTGGRIAIPIGFHLHFLKPEIQHAFNHIQALELIDRYISKQVLGSTTVMETGQHGNYSTSIVHESTTEAKVESISKDIEGGMNRLIKKIVDFNFKDVGGYPTFKVYYRREKPTQQEFTRDIKAIKELKVPYPVHSFCKKYNMPLPNDISEDVTFNPYPDEKGNIVNISLLDIDGIISKSNNKKKEDNDNNEDIDKEGNLSKSKKDFIKDNENKDLANLRETLSKIINKDIIELKEVDKNNNNGKNLKFNKILK